MIILTSPNQACPYINAPTTTVNHFRDASHLVTKPSSLFEHENFRQIITGKGLSGLCGVVSEIASGGGGGGSAIPA